MGTFTIVKKFAFVFAILGCVVAMPAFATTMCVKDDNVAVILDPSIPGTTYSYDNALGRWDTTMPYGHIIGISACVNTSGSYGVAKSDLHDKIVTTNGVTTGTTNSVIGGETTGKYCWCRMTHPAVSLWVFAYTVSSASECASNCTPYCGYYVRNYSDFRAGLFGSVAN